MTKHQEVEKQERREGAWELQVPEPPEVEEKDCGMEEKDFGMEEEEVYVMEYEKKKEGKEEKKEEDDTADSKKKKQQPEDSSEEQKNQDQDVEKQKIFVDFDDTSSFTLEQLRAHFEKYDVVENIGVFRDHAVVTLKSPVIAQNLAGRSHTLQRTLEQGGCVPLRLRGGSGRGAGVPPRQQRNSTCPFR